MALLSEYGFNEGSGLSAADSSGNGHDLTASNSSTSWDANGKNSSGARVQHTGVMGPNTSQAAYTIMAWIKRTTTWSGTAGIVVCVGHGIYFEVNASLGYLTNFFGGNDDATGTTAITINNWFHVAATRDGTGTKLFVNGIQEGSGTSGNGATNFGTGTWAAAPNVATGGLTSDWGGIIDELRVFDTALNAATITTWMNTPIGGPSDVAGLQWIAGINSP